ncbi:MAG: kynureninase [Anaerolineales bacterium]
MDKTDLARAQHLDQQDPLRSFRDRFMVTDQNLIYLDGNSLGRLPKSAQDKAHQVVDTEWGDQLIRSWGQGWMETPTRIGAKLAKLIGAKPHEVILADSTSVNLFKLSMAALEVQAGRQKIITDDLNFPSDVYILQRAAELAGKENRLAIIPSEDGIYGPAERLAAELDADTALLTLSHTVFKSGYTYDMAALTAEAHQHGALVLWDLSHSAGALPVDLNAANADLAVGCTYKYLNGGPGAPAFLFVREDLQEQLDNPISGWMGQHRMFDFSLQYQPEADLRKFLTGTPPMLSMSLIEPGVDLLLEAGMEAVRQKSLHQTQYLIELWENWLAPLGFSLNSPRQPEWRGSHISLGHSEGLRIDQALIDAYHVIPDFRAPDNIRLGIAPLYTSFEEIYRAALALKEIVEQRKYLDYSTEPPEVT